MTKKKKKKEKGPCPFRGPVLFSANTVIWILGQKSLIQYLHFSDVWTDDDI